MFINEIEQNLGVCFNIFVPTKIAEFKVVGEERNFNTNSNRSKKYRYRIIRITVQTECYSLPLQINQKSQKPLQAA